MKPVPHSARGMLNHKDHTVHRSNYRPVRFRLPVVAAPEYGDNTGTCKARLDMTTPLQSLIASGTKVWLDTVDPSEVARNRGWGATGATSNPLIVADLIKAGRYDRELDRLIRDGLGDEETAGPGQPSPEPNRPPDQPAPPPRPESVPPGPGKLPEEPMRVRSKSLVCRWSLPGRTVDRRAPPAALGRTAPGGTRITAAWRPGPSSGPAGCRAPCPRRCTRTS